MHSFANAKTSQGLSPWHVIQKMLFVEVHVIQTVKTIQV